jgi:hypothetical protein
MSTLKVKVISLEQKLEDLATTLEESKKALKNKGRPKLSGIKEEPKIVTSLKPAPKKVPKRPSTSLSKYLSVPKPTKPITKPILPSRSEKLLTAYKNQDSPPLKHSFLKKGSAKPQIVLNEDLIQIMDTDRLEALEIYFQAKQPKPSTIPKPPPVPVLDLKCVEPDL